MILSSWDWFIKYENSPYLMIAHLAPGRKKIARKPQLTISLWLWYYVKKQWSVRKLRKL